MTDFEIKLGEILVQEKQKLADNGIRSGKIECIRVNQRLGRRLGQCIRKTGGVYIIEIAGLLENSTDMLVRQVVMHELLHTCRGCLNHGEKWKLYADIVNRKYGYNIARVYKDDCSEKLPERKYKYVITCSQCGNKGYRLKKSKVTEHPEKYKCSGCGGRITVTPIEEITDEENK